MLTINRLFLSLAHDRNKGKTEKVNKLKDLKGAEKFTTYAIFFCFTLEIMAGFKIPLNIRTT